MATIHVLQHAPGIGPARVADVARALGLGVEVHRVFEEPVPPSIPAGDGLVVMGGTMGVADIGDPRWPFLVDEAALLGRWLRARGPALGVCLGAQLMAHALGAAVRPLVVGSPPVRHREVGWGAVAFAASAEEEPVLTGLNPAEVVFHWHGDTFDLPRGATHLASTLACPQHMFRFGARAFALQFHVEITGEEIERWVREDARFVEEANGPGGGARILADTQRYMPRHREVADRLIANVLRQMFG